ncbi:MAG: hypothetical protein E4G96_02870 [Chrysiogenales bacterium]|nr:MAG: hypothetical protein E4G96_02870 [Chrysiogenales bacterium]
MGQFIGTVRAFGDRIGLMVVGPAGHRLATVSTFFIPILFFTIFSSVNIELFSLPVNLRGDEGAMGLQILRAGEFRELYGIYSRWNWNHPGPVYFYYYALADLLVPIGGDYGRFIFAQLILNCFIAIWILRVVRRMFPDRSYAPALFAMTVIAALRPLGGVVLFSIWPPYSIVIPMLLFFISISAFAAGDAKSFAPLAFSATICFQHQISTAVTLAVMFCAAMCVHLYFVRKGEALYSSGDRSSIVCWCALVCVAFVPMVVDLFTFGMKSNLVKLAKFMLSKGATVGSPVIAFKFVSSFVGDTLGVAGAVPSAVIVFFLCAGVAASVVKAERTLKSLALFSLGGMAMLVFSVMKIRIVPGYEMMESVGRYLLYFEHGLIAILFFVLSMAIISRAGRLLLSPGRIAPVLVAGAAIVVIVAPFLAPVHLPNVNDEIDYFVDAIGPSKEVTSELYFRAMSKDHMQWMNATGIAYRLKRGGFDFCVSDEWLVMFGREHQCAGRESVRRIHLLKPDRPSARPSVNGATHVYKESGIRFGDQ